LWFSFGAADETAPPIRKRHATISLLESLDPCETHAWCGRIPPFLIQDETTYAKLWLKRSEFQSDETIHTDPRGGNILIGKIFSHRDWRSYDVTKM
jgi:hypothetical protein